MEVVGVIGEGGFGRVYAVRHDDGVQALKVMTVDATHDPNLRLRFQREAEVIKRLHSEYVPEVYELGALEDESPFIRMELLQGRSIADVLKETGPLPWRRVIKLGIQACHALGVAHDAGVLHRDLKPDNLFLVGAGDDERVKVLDFGVATFIPGHTDRHGALTHTSAIVGTPYYMSPEQVRSGELAPSSDLYMLGVMLYQMLTGERPFRGDNLGLLLSAILSGQHTPIQELAPGTPRGLVRVIERAMSFEANARFQSAMEMAEALAENIDAESEVPGAFEPGATVPAIPRAPVPRPSNPDAVLTQVGPATSTPTPQRTVASPKQKLAPLVLTGILLMLLGAGLGYAALKARAPRGEPAPDTESHITPDGLLDPIAN